MTTGAQTAQRKYLQPSEDIILALSSKKYVFVRASETFEHNFVGNCFDDGIGKRLHEMAQDSVLRSDLLEYLCQLYSVLSVVVATSVVSEDTAPNSCHRVEVTSSSSEGNEVKGDASSIVFCRDSLKSLVILAAMPIGHEHENGIVLRILLISEHILGNSERWAEVCTAAVVDDLFGRSLCSFNGEEVLCITSESYYTDPISSMLLLLSLVHAFFEGNHQLAPWRASHGTRAIETIDDMHKRAFFFVLVDERYGIESVILAFFVLFLQLTKEVVRHTSYSTGKKFYPFLRVSRSSFRREIMKVMDELFERWRSTNPSRMVVVDSVRMIAITVRRSVSDERNEATLRLPR